MKLEYLEEFLEVSQTLNIDVETIISKFTEEEIKIGGINPTTNQSYKAYLNTMKTYIVDYANNKFSNNEGEN